MRIGLLRHFPVQHGFPSGWRTSADLQSWRQEYDVSEVVVGPFDIGAVEWRACLSSDSPRAAVTAATVFRGPIEQTPLLREAEFADFPTGRLRLPVWGWRIAMQFAWRTGHRSQRACRDEFRSRITTLADRLAAVTEDTLVVTHAGVMAFLSAELRRRGWVGPRLRIAKHATAYVYQCP